MSEKLPKPKRKENLDDYALRVGGDKKDTSDKYWETYYRRTARTETIRMVGKGAVASLLVGGALFGIYKAGNAFIDGNRESSARAETSQMVDQEYAEVMKGHPFDPSHFGDESSTAITLEDAQKAAQESGTSVEEAVTALVNHDLSDEGWYGQINAYGERKMLTVVLAENDEGGKLSPEHLSTLESMNEAVAGGSGQRNRAAAKIVDYIQAELAQKVVENGKITTPDFNQNGQ